MASRSKEMLMICRFMMQSWISTVNSWKMYRAERSYLHMHWIVMESAAAVSKMAFGNRMGAKIEHNVDKR